MVPDSPRPDSGEGVASSGSEARPESRPETRHDRRKARTRTKITNAANRLFVEKGYLATSVEDISESADIAVRTIYTHFPSKAAILLDYFDRWLDALVDALLERPVDEPIAHALPGVLESMRAVGWVDRSYGDLGMSPPSALGLIDGPPEVAGTMMHAWAAAQRRIAADAVERGGIPLARWCRRPAPRQCLRRVWRRSSRRGSHWRGSRNRAMRLRTV